MKQFPFYRQLNAMDCGPTCLRMIARYYGKTYHIDQLKQLTGFGKDGVSLLGISEAAEKIGFRARGVQLTYDQLLDGAPLPCILHWDQGHFVVMLPSNTKRKKQVKLADPAQQIMSYSTQEFKRRWASAQTDEGENAGIALLLEPTAQFYEQEGDKEQKKVSWGRVLEYLAQSRTKIIQIFAALLITSLLQLLFPFLTQSIVDTGINTQDIHYITIVLVAQLMLVFSKTAVDFIRTRLLLKISAMLNLSILSDFWIKLTHLPMSYFEAHHTGDTLQRIGDHKMIQNFLTGSAISTVFSVVNFLIFAVVLLMYNLQIFLVFAAGSILYFLWVRFFLRARRRLNSQAFFVSARENNATLQLVQGMQEIRLNNAEQLKRWEWENLQTGIFQLNLRTLNYSQLQQAGAMFINQGKDIVITFIVAGLVIKGQLTLGAMLAVQYIIGQMSGPVEQFVSFIQSAQDAKMSMERLNEVHSLPDEEDAHKTYITTLPQHKGILVQDLSFAYPGVGNEPVLEHINLDIPEGKVTAIVGVSGSGKTTLLKLLMKFYDHYEGNVRIGETNFKHISPSFWRRQCGAVLQDGFIFNDTIARNIAVGHEVPDYDRLIHSCRTANILPFIESLPNGFYTRLGVNGVGVSQGQRQRLLIARAVYKDPQYLFFDEATNALDANNEKAIVENLQEFFKGRTVLVIAHRLSTVKNADKIVVLHNGRVAEEGTHRELSEQKGRYYELVKNQLDLGT